MVTTIALIITFGFLRKYGFPDEVTFSMIMDLLKFLSVKYLDCLIQKPPFDYTPFFSVKLIFPKILKRIS